MNARPSTRLPNIAVTTFDTEHQVRFSSFQRLWTAGAINLNVHRPGAHNRLQYVLPSNSPPLPLLIHLSPASHQKTCSHTHTGNSKRLCILQFLRCVHVTKRTFFSELMKAVWWDGMWLQLSIWKECILIHLHHPFIFYFFCTDSNCMLPGEPPPVIAR